MVELIGGNKDLGIESLLPFDESFETIEQKAEYIFEGEGRRPSELAYEFTAKQVGLTADRVKKKVKKKYKITR